MKCEGTKDLLIYLSIGPCISSVLGSVDFWILHEIHGFSWISVIWVNTWVVLGAPRSCCTIGWVRKTPHTRLNEQWLRSTLGNAVWRAQGWCMCEEYVFVLVCVVYQCSTRAHGEQLSAMKKWWIFNGIMRMLYGQLDKVRWINKLINWVRLKNGSILCETISI